MNFLGPCVSEKIAAEKQKKMCYYVELQLAESLRPIGLVMENKLGSSSFFRLLRVVFKENSQKFPIELNGFPMNELELQTEKNISCVVDITDLFISS